MLAVIVQRIAEMDVCWTVSPDGSVKVDMAVEKTDVMPYLPRFGLRLFLPESMGKVEYFGYGPLESYADKHRASRLGRFEACADCLHEDYPVSYTHLDVYKRQELHRMLQRLPAAVNRQRQIPSFPAYQLSAQIDLDRPHGVQTVENQMCIRDRVSAASSSSCSFALRCSSSRSSSSVGVLSRWS